MQIVKYIDSALPPFYSCTGMRVPFSIRLDAEVLARIKAIAKAENRSDASVGEDCILGFLPTLERATAARASVLNESPAVPGRSKLPKGKNGISKEREN